MKLNSLLVSLVAGSCASAALAGNQDDVTKFIQPIKVDKVRMVGNLNGNGSGFGSRAWNIDCYNNADLGAYSYIFWGGLGLNPVGDYLQFEKGGYNSAYNFVSAVAAPAKVGEVEFWLVASDATTNGLTAIPTTVSLELFDALADWLPIASTCSPSGDGNIFQINLGGFYVDLTGAFAPWSGYANGYILDVSGLYAGGYFNWNVTDGTAAVRYITWEYNGGNPPVTLAASSAPAFNGHFGPCAYPMNGYPLLGWSADNFYWDVNADGIFAASGERYFFGGQNNFTSNLMLRFAGDEGCSYDLNGDTFVNGDDTDYGAIMASSGCPY